MVEPEQPKHGRVQIVDMHLVFDRAKAELVGRAVGDAAFDSAARHPNAEGLVIVVSDFLDESGCDKALQYLADYGNELMLIQLWTEEDRTPRFSGEYDFIDAETSARLRIQVDADARRQYTAAFDRFAASIRTVAFRNNGRYAGLETSTPLEDAIFGELLKSQVIA